MKKALVIVDLEKGFITKYTKDIPRRIRNFIETKGREYDLIVFTQYKNLNFGVCVDCRYLNDLTMGEYLTWTKLKVWLRLLCY